VVAVLNRASGSCGPGSADQIAEAFETSGLTNTAVHCVDPKDVDEALRAGREEADVLVVLGGDGTIGAAASLCRDGPYLIPLPGGTMNMLPRALYGEGSWLDALRRTLAAPRARGVSGGEAGDHRFYCAAILGAPTLWADAREAVREGHLLEAAKRAVTATRRGMAEPIDYVFGEISGKAEAVAVVCPLISRRLGAEAQALEAVALDPTTAASLFSLAFRAAFDDWRNDPSVVRAETADVEVSAHGEIPVIFDGEMVKLERHVSVRFLPEAFRALVPVDEPESRATAP
jgi:diacylglycerol kinase family enzyme